LLGKVISYLFLLELPLVQTTNERPKEPHNEDFLRRPSKADIISFLIKIKRVREAFQANRSSGRKWCHSDQRSRPKSFPSLFPLRRTLFQNTRLFN